MMRPRLIKTEADHGAALKRIEELMELPHPTQEQEDELELLGKLVSDFEDAQWPIDLPSPVEAIRFRMEQQGLTQSDLVSFFGSRSKVSEVLSGKRTLSLSMIRKLHAELGIPAEVLLQGPGSVLPPATDIEWLRFPIAEMRKRGWFGPSMTLADAKERAEELVRDFTRPAGIALLAPAYTRQHVRAKGTSDPYALFAWRVRVCRVALAEDLPAYSPDSLSSGFMRRLVQLSYLSDGPALAREFLSREGVHLITERHLSRTYLDGAAMLLPDGSPVVALTLRHDRLDNFWFTLCHELAHVALHLSPHADKPFFDDLDSEAQDQGERDADEFAADALIDPQAWTRSGLGRRSTPADVFCFARRLRISPAIPAGRIRRETGDYRLFSQMVGSRRVRRTLCPKGG